MANKKINLNDFMRIPTFILIAAIVFEDIFWLPKLAGVLFIVGSILAIIDTHKKSSHFINYVIYVLLIIMSIYMIVT